MNVLSYIQPLAATEEPCWKLQQLWLPANSFSLKIQTNTPSLISVWVSVDCLRGQQNKKSNQLHAVQKGMMS